MTITPVIDGICRAESARVLSGLIGRFRDFDLAEDAMQDAFTKALEVWPVQGLPKVVPAAWLATVARRLGSRNRTAAAGTALPSTVRNRAERLYLERRLAACQVRWRGDNRGMPALLQNDTFLRACLSQPTEITPVWLMRQAGRYLPEYRATRARAGSFMGLATSPAFATEVTLQPLERYDLDAAILFSDILTVPDAMGLGLSFAEGEGPRFERPIRDEADVSRLAVPDMARLRYVFDAVASIRSALAGKVPLIGFSGSPWTLACYMVEGKGSDDYRLVKTMLYARPDLMHRILAINADAVAQYLNAQIDAGAQAVMVFDSWGGVLADGAFQTFSLAYTERVLKQLKRNADGRRVPHIVFTKGGGPWLEAIAALGPDVVGVDWTQNLGQARKRVGAGVAIQGNIDPNVLFGGDEAIRREVAATLAGFGAVSAAEPGGHVFNLGHGISQYTPPEAVATLVDAVHALSRPYRAEREA